VLLSRRLYSETYGSSSYGYSILPFLFCFPDCQGYAASISPPQRSFYLRLRSTINPPWPCLPKMRRVPMRTRSLPGLPIGGHLFLVPVSVVCRSLGLMSSRAFLRPAPVASSVTTRTPTRAPFFVESVPHQPRLAFFVFPRTPPSLNPHLFIAPPFGGLSLGSRLHLSFLPGSSPPPPPPLPWSCCCPPLQANLLW